MNIFMLIALSLFSGLSLNMFLQMGLAFNVASGIPDRKLGWGLLQWAGILAATLLIWTLFSCLLVPLGIGYVQYFLLFPLAASLARLIDLLFEQFLGEAFTRTRLLTPGSAYDGLLLAAAFWTIMGSAGFLDAVASAAGFVLGALLSLLILREIYRASALEPAPAILKGRPLILISAGILSLVFSAASVLFLRALMAL
jgi:electron transport complex protein RnfA